LIPSNNLWEDIVIKWSGGTWYVIMDRNLWATATWWISCNSSSCRWNHYQWWNNYWFPSTSSPAYTPNSSSQASASGYWPWNYYNSWTFITQNQWWDSANNRNLWWWQWDKESSNWTWTNEDRQWPCPDWYHIPSTWEWKSLSTFWINSALWASNNNNFHNKLFFPLAGYRRWDTAVLDSQTINGYYWSSSPSDTVASSAYFLSISNNSVYSQGNQFRGFGRSIRCFKN
jgi:hypothetical protein